MKRYQTWIHENRVVGSVVVVFVMLSLIVGSISWLFLSTDKIAALKQIAAPWLVFFLLIVYLLAFFLPSTEVERKRTEQ